MQETGNEHRRDHRQELVNCALICAADVGRDIGSDWIDKAIPTLDQMATFIVGGRRNKADIRREGLSLAEINGQFRLSAQYGGTGRAKPVAQPSAVSIVPTEPTTGGAILTIKEREILGLLAQNLSNKEIAIALDLSEQTVKWHLKNLFQKLDGANRKHAVARARMLGLIAA